MPLPHPRLQRGAHLLDDIGDVRDWAPPGWHWEVSPSGGAQLGEDSASRRRPRSYLVAADGARPELVLVAEGAGPRDGGTSPYQG